MHNHSCQIVSRKGKVEDRRPLLLLFSDAPMSAVFNAAASQSTNVLISEHNYRFLKTLTQVSDSIIFFTFLNGTLYLRNIYMYVLFQALGIPEVMWFILICSIIFQVLTCLGSQLCTLWGKEADVTEPQNFHTYLDAMLAFTRHPSLQMYNYTSALWGQLLRHEHASQSPTLQAILPSWIMIVSRKVCHFKDFYNVVLRELNSRKFWWHLLPPSVKINTDTACLDLHWRWQVLDCL